MSAEVTANRCQRSALTTERPSKSDASRSYFAQKHPFGHALGGRSLAMLCKPLPAGLIKASQLSRSRGGRLLAPWPQRSRGRPVLKAPLESKQATVR